MLSKIHYLIQSSTRKTGMFKKHPTDYINNKNFLDPFFDPKSFQDPCSQTVKNRNLLKPVLFCNLARKRIKNVEQNVKQKRKERITKRNTWLVRVVLQRQVQVRGTLIGKCMKNRLKPFVVIYRCINAGRWKKLILQFVTRV